MASQAHSSKPSKKTRKALCKDVDISLSVDTNPTNSVRKNPNVGTTAEQQGYPKPMTPTSKWVVCNAPIATMTTEDCPNAVKDKEEDCPNAVKDKEED
eukprot:c11944_g1_i4 orf=188-481(+)